MGKFIVKLEEYYLEYSTIYKNKSRQKNTGRGARLWYGNKSQDIDVHQWKNHI